MVTAGTSLHPQNYGGQPELRVLAGGQSWTAAHLAGSGVAGGHSTAGTQHTSCLLYTTCPLKAYTAAGRPRLL